MYTFCKYIEVKRDEQISTTIINSINTNKNIKISIQRKQFETNKKMQIANAINSTASAAAGTYAANAQIPGIGPFLAPAMAAAIIALGLAQVAIIRKTQFWSIFWAKYGWTWVNWKNQIKNYYIDYFIFFYYETVNSNS